MGESKKHRGLTPKDLDELRERDRDLKRRQEEELRRMRDFDRKTGRSGPKTIIITETFTWP